VLRYVGLGEARYRHVETYSTGMKQRIKLAQALVHDPDLLFLDEPTNGLDPRGREEMLRLVHDISHNKGLNVIVSSHLLPDIELTCDEVIVLDRGRVAAAGRIDALKGEAGRTYELRVRGELAPFVASLLAAGVEAAQDGEAVRVRLPEHGTPRVVFRVAAEQGLQIRHLRATVPTLEDVFARAVGGHRLGERPDQRSAD
jgi:ABC-2 type transport system ATP-binding protein